MLLSDDLHQAVDIGREKIVQTGRTFLVIDFIHEFLDEKSGGIAHQDSIRAAGCGKVPEDLDLEIHFFNGRLYDQITHGQIAVAAGPLDH